jgi:hypothetical protein
LATYREVQKQGVENTSLVDKEDAAVLRRANKYDTIKAVHNN